MRTMNIIAFLKRIYGLDNSDTVLNFNMGRFRFEFADDYLIYKTPAKMTRIPISDIETVSVVNKSLTQATIKIVGRGTELGTIDLLKPWAEKAQDFLLKRVKT